MNDYTVVFEHPDQHTPEYVHIRAADIRSAHLMFFGKLATAWGYGWDHMRFAEYTDVSQAHGTIMIAGNALRYTILSGRQRSENGTTSLR
jgi:hypothetical protein